MTVTAQKKANGGSTNPVAHWCLEQSLATYDFILFRLHYHLY